MKLAIQGSRSLTDSRVREIIKNEIEILEPEKIVTSAKISGVCQIAREVSAELSIPLTVHFTNKKYAGGMHERRSKAVQNDSDIVIFIYDGVSNGTRNEIELSKKTGKPHKIHILKQPDLKGVADFEIGDFSEIEF